MSTEFRTSTLMAEVNQILTKGLNGTAYSLEAFVKVKREGKAYRSPKVVSHHVVRDYINNFSDKTIISLAFTGGVFAKHIYPNADDLEVIFIRRPIFNIDGKFDHGRHTLVETFTATLSDNKDPNLNLPKDALDERVLDQANLITVDFDLISKTAEQLNMIVCGGIVREKTTEQLIRSVFTNEACQGGNDKNVVVKGVDMVPSEGLQPREHIVVPQGVKLIDLPNYLQNKCGGVYTTGVGYYLQERYWYIYPAFDFTRFNRTERTITFINTPKDAFPSVEVSYRRNGKQIIALANGDTSVLNTADVNMRNGGNGVSFTTATSVMNSMMTPGGNKAIFDRSASTTEVKTQERRDGLSYVPVGEVAITDNVYQQLTERSQDSIAILNLLWEYSEPTEIVPGMLARVYYYDGKETRNCVGVIAACEHYTYMYQRGITSTRYVTNTAVTIFVDPTNLEGKETASTNQASTRQNHTPYSKDDLSAVYSLF